MAAERRNGFLTVVVVALVVVAAVAVGVVLRSRDPARGPQVLAVGDSVTYMSANPIKDAFDWTDNVDVQGRPGYRTDQLVPMVGPESWERRSVVSSQAVRNANATSSKEKRRSGFRIGLPTTRLKAACRNCGSGPCPRKGAKLPAGSQSPF